MNCKLCGCELDEMESCCPGCLKSEDCDAPPNSQLLTPCRTNYMTQKDLIGPTPLTDMVCESVWNVTAHTGKEWAEVVPSSFARDIEVHAARLREDLSLALECINEFKVAMSFVTGLRPGSENAFHRATELAAQLTKLPPTQKAA